MLLGEFRINLNCTRSSCVASLATNQLIMQYDVLRTLACEFEVNRDQQHEEANRPRIPMRNHPDLQYLKKEMYVVIQTSLEDFEDLETNHRYRSKDEMSRRIRLEQSWRIVPVTSITAPVFVIPEDETQMNMSTIDHFWVREKLEWPGLFLS